MSRLRFLLPVFLLMWLAAASSQPARAESPAAANKRLFDRTVDELNFQTMETVYDKSFTRNKFPVTLRTHQARKQFDGFGGNAELKKLFLNYNDVSERFKSRFGKGRTDLVEFEKQLNSLLIDKNFEFFIRVLPRDERIALIRSLQRVIKQGTAQFNASEDPAPEDLATDGAAVPPADVDADNTAPAMEDLAPQPEAQPTPAAVAPRPISSAGGSPHDWVDYLTLALVGSSTLLLLYFLTSALPDLRARLDSLADQFDEQSNTPPRPRRRAGLPEDRYDEEEQ